MPPGFTAMPLALPVAQLNWLVTLSRSSVDLQIEIRAWCNGAAGLCGVWGSRLVWCMGQQACGVMGQQVCGVMGQQACVV